MVTLRTDADNATAGYSNVRLFMTPNGQAIRRAVFAQSFLLVVASLVPVWVVWSISPLCGVGRPGTLWQVIWQLPSNMSQLSTDHLLRLHLLNLVYLGVLVVFSLLVGWLVYWRQLVRLTKR